MRRRSAHLESHLAAAYNRRMDRIPLIVAVCLTLAVPAAAGAETVAPGAGGFCLFRLPADDSGKQRWINLGIVQFVEVGRDELKIAYGGGSFGSGYEAHIPVANAEEAQAHLTRMRQAAAACR